MMLTLVFLRFIGEKFEDGIEKLRQDLINQGINPDDESLSVNDENTSANIRKAIASGFFYNSAHLSKDGVYRTIKNAHVVNIHPTSSLIKDNPRWVIYHELVYTTKEYMREIIEIEPEWLMEVAPHYYKNIDLSDKDKGKNKGTNKINY